MVRARLTSVLVSLTLQPSVVVLMDVLDVNRVQGTQRVFNQDVLILLGSFDLAFLPKRNHF